MVSLEMLVITLVFEKICYWSNQAVMIHEDGWARHSIAAITRLHVDT